MPCSDKTTGLIPFYIEGELGADQKAHVEGHLRGCDECRAAYEEMRSIMSTLHSLEVEELPEGFHEEFMKKLADAPKPKPAFLRRDYKLAAQTAACAAAALIVVSAASVGVTSMLGLDRPEAQYQTASVEAYDIRAYAPQISASGGAQAGKTAQPAEAGPAETGSIASSITSYNIEIVVDDVEDAMGRIALLSGSQVSSNYNKPAYEGSGANASITRRAPPHEFPIIKNQLRAMGRVSRESESKESMGRALNDLKARLAAKDEERSRLLGLLALSSNLDVMVMIDTRLSGVSEECESLNAQIRDFNRQIGQPYINIQVYNRVYAPAPPPKQGLGARMANSFKKSVNGTALAMQGMLIFVVSAFVPIVSAGAFILLAFLLFRRLNGARLAKDREGGREQ